MTELDKCPTCNNTTKEFWRYCRHCGQKLEGFPQSKAEELDEKVFEQEKISLHDVTPQPEFDRDLYYKVLSNREKRSRLSKQKIKLKEDISALLAQLQSKVITREFAAPKIEELKVSVASVNKDLTEFKDLPTELPIEILNDEIDAAQAKIRKLEKLKSDETISKDAITVEREKAREILTLLQEQKSKVAGYLRNWLDDVKNELKEEREDFDSLNIKFRIQEITDDTFKERKV
ncbi:MAG: hypothetical protein ACC656_07720 [Candidatus Heimdallarchaeota archaeon]